MATLTDRLQAYLIAQGIGRDPRVAGPLPPIWRQPVDGTPAPGEGVGVVVGPTVVIGLIHGVGFASPRFESGWRTESIDIWYRTTTWPLALTTYVLVRDSLIDKVNWVMSGMRVIESMEWRGHQLLESNAAQGFTSMSSVRFTTYKEEHS